MPTAAIEAIRAKALKKNNSRIGSLSEVASDVKAITTGNLAIDEIIGVGGIPLGRSVELFGKNGSGKTTLAIQYAAKVQEIIKAGGDEYLGIGPDDVILYLDYEQSMDPDYVMALGLDVEHSSFQFFQPDTFEEGAGVMKDYIESGDCRVVIVDSVASMNPSAQAEAEVGKALPAVLARLLKPFLTSIQAPLYKNNCTAIFINHEMEKMGMNRPGLPPTITTPGGEALKYYASLRLRFRKAGQNMEEQYNPITNAMEKVPTSSDVIIKVEKNKVSRPFRSTQVRVAFGRGFDEFATALMVLTAHKHIVYAAGNVKFHNLEAEGLAPDWMPRLKTGHQHAYVKGEDGAYQAADAHPEWRQAVIEKARQVVKDAGSLDNSTPAEDDGDDELDVDPTTGEVKDSNRVAFGG